MRVGDNIAKISQALPRFGRHRVVMPVYIPSGDGYYAQSLEILRLSLESLRLTTANRAAVTVIVNGSMSKVDEELRRRYQEGWIDQLIINRSNRGKVDAVISAARATFEELITITDCDVLFMSGWVEAVEDVFRHFPECGVASPAPNPRLSWYQASATILGALVNRELKYEKVVPDIDLDRFETSIGSPGLFGAAERSAQMIVRRNEGVACVGCGHFIFTIRREVVAAMPREPSCEPLGDHEKSLDQPADSLGLWRLATTRAYAYHMGNAPEDWMYQTAAKTAETGIASLNAAGELPAIRRGWPSRMPLRLRQALTSTVRKLAGRRLA